MVAVNGVGLIIVSQIVALLVAYINRFKLMIYLTLIQVVGVILIVITLAVHGPLWILLIAFFLNVCPVTSIGLQWQWKNVLVVVVMRLVY